MAIKKNVDKKSVPDNSQSKEEKRKALETAIAQIEKAYGAGAVMRLGQNSTMNVEAIPTGSLNLDMALGIGGVPRGRIVEIYGPESSGKNNRRAPHPRRGSENGRRCGVYRRGARPRPGIRLTARRGYRLDARFPSPTPASRLLK